MTFILYQSNMYKSTDNMPPYRIYSGRPIDEGPIQYDQVLVASTLQIVIKNFQLKIKFTLIKLVVVPGIMKGWETLSMKDIQHTRHNYIVEMNSI